MATSRKRSAWHAGARPWLAALGLLLALGTCPGTARASIGPTGPSLRRAELLVFFGLGAGALAVGSIAVWALASSQRRPAPDLVWPEPAPPPPEPAQQPAAVPEDHTQQGARGERAPERGLRPVPLAARPHAEPDALRLRLQPSRRGLLAVVSGSF